MAGAGDSQGGFFRRTQDAVAAVRPDWEFINQGVGGDTTCAMLARVGDAVGEDAHDLIVMLGCNDLPRANDSRPQIRTTPGEYEQNLRKLLPQIKGGFSLFITSFPVCADRTGVADDLLASSMSAARTIASESGYEIWDLFGELQGTDLTPYWAADGLHFNDAGHAMITARLTHYLTTRYRPASLSESAPK